MLNYTHEDVVGHSEGDIITINGKKFFLEKKTSRTVKVRRWYWFDSVTARVVKLLGGA